MFTPFRRFSLFAALLASLGMSSAQALTINGFTAAANNRWAATPTDPIAGPFTPNTQPGFLALNYDLSGVGWQSTSSGYKDLSVTLVSPLHFAAAKHVTFGYTNTNYTFANTANTLVSRSIGATLNKADIVFNGGAFPEVRVVRLDTGFTPSDQVAIYRLLDVGETTNIIGYPALLLGHDGSGANYQRRVGLSTVSDVEITGSETIRFNSSSPATNYATAYVTGDSGSPSFIVYEGQLHFAGCHWLSGLTDSNWMLPGIYPGVNAFLSADGYALRWTIDSTKAENWNGNLDGTFGTLGNWLGGSALPSASVSAVFDAAETATRSINLTTPAAVRGIRVKTAAGTNPFTLSGSTLTLHESGLRNEDSDTLTLNTPVTLGGSQNWEAAAGPITIGGNVATAGFLVVLSGEQALTLSGNFTGTGSVAWDNPGTWSPASGQFALTSGKLFIRRGTVALTTANPYSGGTVVTGGTLLANNPTGSATGSGSVTLSNTARLGGNGTLTGPVTFQNTSGLFAHLTTGPGSHDKLDVTGALSLGTTGTLTITATASATTGTYTLVTAAGGITGALPTLSLPAGWSASAQIAGNNLNLVVTSLVPTAPVITGGQTTTATVNTAFSYSLATSQNPTGFALVGGSLPPGITLNPTTGALSGTPTAVGIYSPVFTASNALGTSAPVGLTFLVAPAESAILYEPFAYPIGTNNPDPDGGLNSNNGLPATNVGGSPSGTSTGLRNTYGSTLDVAPGLTYSQGQKSLVTRGGSGAPNNATWGTDVFVYRSMATDPHLARRVGGSTTGSFGVNGESLFFSFLARSASTTTRAFWLNFSSGSRNLYVGNTASTWSIEDNAAGAVGFNGAFTPNTPALLVVRLTFAAGATDTLSLWVNPPLGEPLPATPNATLTIGADWSFGQMNFRPQVLGAMTMDEFRMGASYAAVTPYVEAPPLTADELWRQTWFGDIANAGNAADSADPDGDGVTNTQERAAGSDPLAPNAPGTATTTSLPARLLTLAPVADATADASAPTVNSSSGDIQVRSETAIREAFLRYDLAALAGTVERAQLVFWPTVNDSQTPTFTIQQIADAGDAWTESGLTWNNKPASLAANAVSFAGPVSAGIPRVVEVTAMVADTLSNDAAKQLGLRLFTTGSMPTQAASFGSKENGAAYRFPYLHITLRASAATPTRILPVGDSITRGSAGGVGSNTFSNAGWRYYLHNLLLAAGLDSRAVGPRFDGSVASFRLSSDGSTNSSPADRPLLFPANAGYSGMQISYIRDNIAAWMAASPPDVITLMIGTNDVGYANTPSFAATQTEIDGWKSRYTTLLNNILAASPTVKVVMATITPAGGANVANNTNRIEPFNTQVVQALHAQYSTTNPGRFFLVDNYAAITPSDISGDGVHPTSLGHQKLARSWHAGLMAALGRADEVRFVNEYTGADAPLRAGTLATTALGNATTPLAPGWTNALLRAKSDPVADNRAKPLLKFDLAGLPAHVGSATLGFAYHGATPTGDLPANTTLLHLYGIKDGSDTWTKSAVTWNSAPGHDASSNGVLPANVVYVASTTVPIGARTGDLVTFGSPALADFLTAQVGADDVASFVIIASGRQSTEAILHASNQPDYQPPFLLVTEAPSGLATFRTTFGLAANGSQDTATPAGDGVANLLKYAFNMLGSDVGQASSLSSPNSSVLTPAGSAGLPLLAIGTGPDAGKLQLTFIRRKASTYPGITYAVQFSNDLAVSDPWAVNPAATESAVSLDATFERVTVTDSAAAPARRFTRVRVTTP
jgi:autotransporter-associated beta strand protein